MGGSFIPYKHQKKNKHPSQFINEIEEWSEKQYNPYLINRALSFGHDTIIPANEMNCRAHLDKRLQNTFLINIVQPRKRYNKWLKPEKLENLELVQQYYGYSIKKARHVLALLNDSQIKTIKEKLFKGGL